MTHTPVPRIHLLTSYVGRYFSSSFVLLFNLFAKINALRCCIRLFPLARRYERPLIRGGAHSDGWILWLGGWMLDGVRKV